MYAISYEYDSNKATASMNMITGTVRGSKTKSIEYEYLIILKEVCASKAHIACYGHIRQQFTKSVESPNLNRKLTRNLNSKIIQDRYKKI